MQLGAEVEEAYGCGLQELLGAVSRIQDIKLTIDARLSPSLQACRSGVWLPILVLAVRMRGGAFLT
jgi:hypothetical protein